MRTIKCAAALAAVGTLLLLAACGGGGGSSTGSSSTGSSSTGSSSTGSSSTGSGSSPGWQALSGPGTLDREQTQEIVGDAGTNDNPSNSTARIHQASNNVGVNVSIDASRRVRLNGSPQFDLNTEDHGLSSAGFQTPVAGHTGRSWGLGETADVGTFGSEISKINGVAVFVSWDNANPTADWLVGGYWLSVRVDTSDGSVFSPQSGAFIAGPELADRSSMPGTGTATYTGVARGIYTYDKPSGDAAVEEALGTIELTADFANTTIGGSISGFGANLNITLNPTGWQNTGRITPRGTVSIEDNGQDFGVSGRWTGRFSNRDDSDGHPRLVAGTAGAKWEDDDDAIKGSFISAFIAAK